LKIINLTIDDKLDINDPASPQITTPEKPTNNYQDVYESHLRSLPYVNLFLYLSPPTPSLSPQTRPQ